MPKPKKNPIANLVKKRPKRKGFKKFKRNPDGPTSSPSTGGGRFFRELKGDATQVLLPAAGGYVASRLASRIANIEAAKRFPRLGKHAGPLASLVVLGLAIFSGKWRSAAPYRLGLLIGAGLASLQTVLKTYVPGLAWLIDSEVKVSSLPAPANTAKAVTTEPDYEEVLVASPTIKALPEESPEDVLDDAIVENPLVGSNFDSGLEYNDVN